MSYYKVNLNGKEVYVNLVSKLISTASEIQFESIRKIFSSSLNLKTDDVVLAFKENDELVYFYGLETTITRLKDMDFKKWTLYQNS